MSVLRLNQRVQENLAILAQQDGETLSSLKNLRADFENKLIPLPKLLDNLTEKVGDERVALAILSLAQIAHSAPDSKKSPASLKSELELAMRRAGMEEDVIVGFKNVADNVLDFCASDVTSLSMKVSELFYGPDKHLHRIKMYTNSRPVFDMKKDAIRGYIVNTKLSIVVNDSSDNEEVVEASISLSQLRELLKDVEWAIGKLKKTAKHLNAETGLPIVSDLDDEAEE